MPVYNIVEGRCIARCASQDPYGLTGRKDGHLFHTWCGLLSILAVDDEVSRKGAKMNEFVYKTLCHQYQEAAKKMIDEFRQQKSDMSLIVSENAKEYKEALDLLRRFLDHEGIRMPKPKWVYDHRNQQTWLYSNRQTINSNFQMLRSRFR